MMATSRTILVDILPHEILYNSWERWRRFWSRTRHESHATIMETMGSTRQYNGDAMTMPVSRTESRTNLIGILPRKISIHFSLSIRSLQVEFLVRSFLPRKLMAKDSTVAADLKWYELYQYDALTLLLLIFSTQLV